MQKHIDLTGQRFGRWLVAERAECVDLSEHILLWGSEQGVQWSPTSLSGDEVTA